MNAHEIATIREACEQIAAASEKLEQQWRELKRVADEAAKKLEKEAETDAVAA